MSDKVQRDRENNVISDNCYFWCYNCGEHVYHKDAIKSVELDPVTQQPIHTSFTCPKCGSHLGC